MKTKNFCGFCGSVFQTLQYPKTCSSCGEITWKNPIPVTFVLQPVWDRAQTRLGLAVSQRARDPGAGEWAFIGGFVDQWDKSLEEAARREFREETGLELVGNANIIHSELNVWGQMVVAVKMDGAMTFDEYAQGQVCDENLQLGILWDPTELELCFPIHQKIAEKWFRGDL